LYQPTDQGYATIGPSQDILGRMDGMNEKGLSIGYNSIHHKKPKIGFISNMIARIVLENCGNVSEALTMLKEIPHRHSFNYVLLDENEETFIIEASPRGIEIRQSNICTNHFDILTDENRHHLDDSMKRFDAIRQQETDIQNMSEAFNLLNNPEKRVFSKNYHSSAGTIHTAVYLPKQKQTWFALGGNQQPFVSNFSNWLQGENIITNRIYGEIDTDIPFLHIDKM
jgi:predicted choloylglycine hydrolase